MLFPRLARNDDETGNRTSSDLTAGDLCGSEIIRAWGTRVRAEISPRQEDTYIVVGAMK